MPATSAKQQRFMAMVAHDPGAVKSDKPLPPHDVAEEFSHKPKGGYRDNAVALHNSRKNIGDRIKQ